MSSVYSIDKLMSEARRLAADYRRATGKVLPISGEIASNDAIRLLGLEAAPPNAVGYDAVRRDGDKATRIQVKARVIFETAKSGQRIGQLRLEQAWDSTVLVLMDDNYEPFEMYEADRQTILEALEEATPNRRGLLSVARFRIIGELVWTREDGTGAAKLWSNR